MILWNSLFNMYWLTNKKYICLLDALLLTKSVIRFLELIFNSRTLLSYKKKITYLSIWLTIQLKMNYFWTLSWIQTKIFEPREFRMKRPKMDWMNFVLLFDINFHQQMWNIFRYLADFSHLISVVILLHKMITKKTCSGISLKTQLLFLLLTWVPLIF